MRRLRAELLTRFVVLAAELFSVSEKVIIVTGGATGIGLAASRLFLENGARVAIFSLPGDFGPAS